MADDWVDVPAAPAAAPPAGDGWEDVPRAGEASPQAPISGPNGWSTAAKGMVNSTSVGSIMRAFGEGFGEAWGPERLGLSKESTDYLSKAGIFAPAGQKNYENPFQAFNEGVIVNTAAALDAAWRTAGGVFRGGQAAVFNALGEGSFARDVAAIPEAFMGSPGTLGEIRMRPSIPVGDGLKRIVLDAPSDVGIEAAPVGPERIVGAAIRSKEGVVFSGVNHGDAGTNLFRAGHELDPKEAGDGFITSTGRFVDRDEALDIADKAKQLYDPELNHTNRPDASLHARDLDMASAKDLGVIGPEKPTIDEAPKSAEPAPATGLKLVDAPEGGVYTPEQFRPGEKYFKAVDSDGNVAAEMLVKIDGTKASIEDILNPSAPREAGIGSLGNAQLRGLLKQFREQYPEVEELTGRRVSGARMGGEYSLTGEPTDISVMLPQAKDLGVIGPEKPTIADGPPKDVAEKVVSRNADQAPGEKVTQEVPGEKDAWQERFEGFVNKLEAPADVQQLIKDAAKENGDFLPARQGDIPLSHVEGIADAAGVAPDEINARGLGRKLQNDSEVRVAMQMMLQVTDDVKNAAREVKADGSPESMIKLQQAIMRRDLAVEQVVGLRAEWGRTGNVIQEFTREVKDQQGLSDFLKGKGRTPADLTDIAHTIDALDRGQAARLLNDLRTPSTWDKFKFYWVNALISGPVTHAKYIVANGAFAAYESAAVTPVAGAIGAVRRGLTGGAEGVYMGEAAARTWGIVAGVPDALKAAVSAAKTGMQTPLPGELAQSIIPKQNKNIAFQQKPITGALGTVIGAPSRGASAIHSFFNFLGYRASIEAQAYRAAAKDGLKPIDDAFWQRRADAADRPTPEMMNDAIEEGYKLTYISELGETGKKLSSFVNSTKVGQLIMPFTHIPLNILKRAIEGTPAAFLDAATREELTGAKGAVKQDTAIARMVVGSAVGAWAVNQVLNERMTGFGPTDPKERAQWLATGHQPYSIRIGDYWYSFNRFGSLGTMLGLYSNLAEVIPHMKPDAEELTKAVGMAVHSTGRLMEDEVGMQGLAGLMDAINEPDKKGTRFVSNFAGSLLPYSSMQRQIASSMDPYMRETKSVVDGLRYYIPVAREGLLPKRDWSGLPVANAGYGGDTAVPGVSSIIQHRNAVADPVALEMATLDLHPAPPQNRISGVKLPPKIYDTYQATAGTFTHSALEHFVEQPGWHDLPPFIREKMFRATIEATRKSAGAAVQMQYPEIIQQGVADRVAKINGVKPTKLQDR